MKNYIKYVLSFFLFVFYLGVLYCAFDVDVTDEYRLYFIDRKIKYYMVDGELDEYKPDVKLKYDCEGSYKNIGKGWSYPEENGIWTEGDESIIYFKTDEINDYILSLEYVSDFGYDYIFYINGEKCELVNAEPNSYTIKVLKENVKNGINEFVIKSKDEVKPVNSIVKDSNETRELGMFVNLVEIKKVK